MTNKELFILHPGLKHIHTHRSINVNIIDSVAYDKKEGVIVNFFNFIFSGSSH